MSGTLFHGFALISEIMRLSEGAVKFHGKMAGGAKLPESFVRDWVAIGLHRQRRLPVSVEVLRSQFLKDVVHETQHSTLAQLDLKNFRLDMIVWEGDHPRAIIEFKNSTKVGNDTERTSQLLSVTPEQTDLRGYLLSCCIFSPEAKFVGYKAEFESSTAARRVGNVLASNPTRIFNGHDDWCGIFAAEVAKPLIS
jgi:hypothetical protein